MRSGMTKHTDRKAIVRIILFLVTCFCFAGMILDFCTLTEKVYDTIRTYYLYRAVFWLLIILFIENKSFMPAKMTIVYTALAIIIIGLGLFQYRHSPDLIRMFGFKWLCYALGLYFVIEAFFHHKIPKKGEWNYYLIIPYLFANFAACLICKGSFHTQIPFFPVLLMFFLRLSYKKWEELLTCFTIGYYTAFLIIMILSFIKVPYTGKRYYGIYLNHGLFGIFVGGAFVCSLYWLIKCINNETKKRVYLLLAVFALLFSFLSTVIIDARTEWFALIITVWICIFSVDIPFLKKKSWYFRLILSISGMALILFLGIALLYMLKNINREILGEMKNAIIREKLTYWNGVARSFFNPQLHSSVGADSGFKEGTLLNAIDRLTSNRLGWFSVYFQQMNLWGHDSLCINTPSGIELSYPHSVYVAWLFRYGILIGSINIIDYLANVVFAISCVIKKRSYCLLAMLWLVYSAATMLPETVYWNVQVAFVSLILLYPLFLNMDIMNKNLDKEKQ